MDPGGVRETGRQPEGEERIEVRVSRCFHYYKLLIRRKSHITTLANRDHSVLSTLCMDLKSHSTCREQFSVGLEYFRGCMVPSHAVVN